MSLKPGARLGPYEIRAPLGAGGMGEVYRARDARLARDVALKVLPAGLTEDPDRLRRFEQEARAAGALNHPNTLAIYDVGTHEGFPYIVSELLTGETLRERLRGPALTIPRVIDYSMQIANGLAAAHGRGIVHRDLKPENLFVTRDGVVKILDFGIAKLLQSREPRPEGDGTATVLPGTDAGLILGSAGYMSPEQVRGDAVDHRSDIFSFGAFIYEMAYGRRAFAGESAVETMTAILKDDPFNRAAGDRNVPLGLERIIRHCLEKRAEDRFQATRDLAFDLEALSMPTGPDGSLVVPRRASQPYRIALGVVAALALTGLAVVAGARLLPRRIPTYHQLTFRQGWIGSARFAGDGSTVVYGAAWDGRPLQVYAVRPGSPESRSLPLPPGDLLSVSSKGELAVSLGRRYVEGWATVGTLAHVPLEGGAPREVLEEVQEADWAPGRDELAVVRVANAKTRLEYPIGNVVYQTSGWITHARFSPRGDRIAFLEHPAYADDRGDVVTFGLDGGKRVLSRGWSSIQGVGWSPDGEEVWFTAEKFGESRRLHAVSLGGKERLLAEVAGDLWLQDVSKDGRALVIHDRMRTGILGRGPSDAQERDLSWLDYSYVTDLSRDGTSILFTEYSSGVGPTYAVYMRRTDGSPAVRLADGLSATLSPDARWALVLTLEPPGRLLLVPTGPGQPKPLTDGTLNCLAACWISTDRILVMANESERSPRLFVGDLEGRFRPIAPEGVTIPMWGNPVSPDGRTVAAQDANEGIRLFATDAGEPRHVEGSKVGDRPIQWSEDGRSLYVWAKGTLPAKVFRIEVSTGRRQLWREFMPSDPAGIVQIETLVLTPDERAYAYTYERSLDELYVIEGLR
jgi:hypothetical protein